MLMIRSSQITAVCVSIVPLWSLSVALYKYPALRRRRKKHEQRRQMPLTEASRSVAPEPFPRARSWGSGHAPHPSDTSAAGVDENETGYEMQPFSFLGSGSTRPAYSPVPLIPESPETNRRHVLYGPRAMNRRRPVHLTQ